MKPKVTIYFDARKVIISGADAGRSHVKIMVAFYDVHRTRTRRYYKTGVFATREEFEKISTGATGRSLELGKKREKLLQLEAKAIDEAKPFIHPDEFESRFTGSGGGKSPLDMLLAYSEELARDGQVGTAVYYKSAYTSFHKFSQGHLTFYQVTAKWLYKYENWLLEQGRSISTVGTHVRPMRTIFKKAIDERIIPVEFYPFGRNQYRCPSAKGRKIALSEVNKNVVLSYQGDWIKDVSFWILSYFCNGANFADIAHWRRFNLNGDILTFFRTKTKRTTRDKAPIVITLRPEALQIIAKYGNTDLSPDAHIFPILRDGLTPAQQRYIIQDWIKETNENLEKACEKMKIPKITTYWARHTFATIAKNKGASIEFIQEALGHSDTKTTKSYLDSFDIESKRKISDLL